MRLLLASDLHLTARRRDAYRMQIFDFLLEEAVESEVDHVVLLGDVTDAKDRHPAALVNSVVDGLCRVSDQLPKHGRVWWLLGNHDCVDPSSPFFEFVNDIPGICLIHEPCDVELPARDSEHRVLMLPHSRDWKRDWPSNPHFDRYEFAFTHVTVTGAIAENGQPMEGVPREYFDVAGSGCRVYSGDIHVPQRVGDVEYVGAPYRIRFGDTFPARCLLIDGDQQEDLTFPFPEKSLLEIESAADLLDVDHPPGTQVKIRVRLPRTSLVDWTTIRREILAEVEKREWDQCGIELVALSDPAMLAADRESQREVLITPEEALREYCTKQAVDETTADLGLRLLNEVRA